MAKFDEYIDLMIQALGNLPYLSRNKPRLLFIYSPPKRRSITQWLAIFLVSFPVLLPSILAQTKGEQSLRQQLTQSSGKQKVDILNQLCEYYENSEPVKARQYAQQAVELSQDLSYPQGKALALKHIGVIYLIQGNNSQALEYFLNSLKIYERLKYPAGIAETLNNIGIVYQNLRKFDQARSYYRRVLKIDEETQDRKGQASTLNNIGDIYYQQDRFPTALQYYRRSLKVRTQLNDQSGIATSLKNIGIVYYTQNEYARALSYFFRSLEIDRERKNDAGTSATLNNIAGSYLKLGQLDTALAYAQHSLEIAEQINLKREIVEASFTLADIYATQGDYQKAYEYQLTHLIYKDELYNEQNEKKIADLQTSYELEKNNKK